MISAIPDHLRCPRLRQLAIKDDFVPPYPAMVARFPENMEQVVMVSLGIQFPGDQPPAIASQAQHCLKAALNSEGGPTYWDESSFVDQQGYTNLIAIAYWTAPAQYQGWKDQWMSEWTQGAFEGLGTFIEVLQPGMNRFETLFSAHSQEGAANCTDTLSPPMQEHGYWGSMRDRLPLSQTDAMSASGTPTLISDGHYQRVTGHENLCLIRSGQDWSATQGKERDLYLNEVEPVLQAGMDFLEREGLTVGCFNSRYMRIRQPDGQLTDRSFGLSLWNDLADLEAWAKSHPTHLNIFSAAMAYLGEYGPDAQLRLYHEVCVVQADEQVYEYFNCHPATGMLKKVTAS